ncbi:NAD dependent epimerase/dehydratase family protein [Rhexocercosporidium sp. MPI-PUGE-AT-0058]|nr:NAD dependent epimerase/dehydratase family protein [Rhexocercosporidium sp. MPI-PUGE-AT-0058]
MSEPIRILLLGATGYIGGSILTELIDRNVVNRYVLSALVRKPFQASILADAGVSPLIFKDLDDFDVIRAVARDHDMVIAAASARHIDCARACLLGLGDRAKSTGNETHYIHISGASILGDWPVSGERIDTKIYSDTDDDIYDIEKNFPDAHSPVREVDLVVVETGEKEGVKTYIVPPPLIFGRGTGSFTLGVGQVHMMTQLSLKKKRSVMLGSGSGIWNRVHIGDLTDLFTLLVRAIIDGKNLPFGKTGFYFVENGFQTWKSISEGIGKAGKELGAFETEEVVEITMQEAAEEFYDGKLRDAEGVLASNSRTKADKARQILGWQPKYGEEAFLEEIEEVVAAMIEEQA